MTSVGSPNFRIGVTRLHFQTEGKIPSARDLLNIPQIGKVRWFLQQNKKMAEIPSGPEPRVVANDSRAADTSSGVIVIEDGRNENCSVVIKFN